MKKLDLQIAQERNKTPSATTGVTAQRPRLSKGFPAMTTEDLPCYLDMFEMAARRDKVLEEDWVAQLQEKITPKLRQFLTQRRLVDCTDYEKIKKELLDYVGMTEEACRKRWHETVPIEDGPREFFVALQKNFRQWCEAAKIERNFDQLEELILKDSILSALNEEVREEILDKEPESLEKLVDLLENRKIIFSSKSIFKKSRTYQANAVGDRNLNRQNYYYQTSPSRPNYIRPNIEYNELRRNFVRPRYSNSYNRARGRWNRPDYTFSNQVNNRRNNYGNGMYQNNQGRYRNETRRNYSNQAECAVVQLPDRQGTCNLIYHNPESVANFIMNDKSIGSLNIEVGKLNGRKASILRDSGCSVIAVRETLVNEKDILPEKCSLCLADGQIFRYKTAKAMLDTPYLKGEFIVVLFPEPVADVLIGNVKGLFVSAVETRGMKDREREETQVKTPIIGTIIEGSLEKEQEEDETLAPLWRKCTEQTTQVTKEACITFVRKKSLLYKRVTSLTEPQVVKDLLVVPKGRRKLILENAHSSPLAGHMSVKKTKLRIYSEFYWPGVDKDVKQLVRCCDPCQRAKVPGRAGKAVLGKMDRQGVPFRKFAIDLVGPLPMTESKHRYILTMIDTFSRWPEAVPLRNIETTTVIEALYSVCTRIGFPEAILSDNGSQYGSDLYTEVCKFFNVKIIKSSLYHPASNGCVERLHGSLKSILRKLCSERSKDWDKYLASALFAIRELPNDTTGFSPYELVFGRKIRGPMAILKKLMTKEKEVDTNYTNLFEYLEELKERLQSTAKIACDNEDTARQEQKRLYDRNTVKKSFATGEMVLVLKPKKGDKLKLYWEVEVTSNNVANSSCKSNILSAAFIGVVDEYDHDETGQIIDNEIEELKLPEMIHGNGEINQRAITINKDLNQTQKNEVEKLFEDFAHVISDVPGKAKVEPFKITLTSDKPVNLKPYNVPMAMRQRLQEEIESMINMNIIEESESPYASPMILIKKKDGTLRPVVDYRQLNSITKFDAEVIPDQEELFITLRKAKYFSKLDLTKGYWQVPLEESSKQYTAFKVPNAHYQFKYLPFGLKNSPSFFNRTMRRVLKGLEQVVCYFDDLCVYNADWHSHMFSLRQVLERLGEFNITVKPNKLLIGFQTITFLGHKIGQGFLQPENSNVSKILQLRYPKTKKETRSLLGLLNYYRSFIPNFSSLLSPFTEILKKGHPSKVAKTVEGEVALERIQRYLTSHPILMLPDPDKCFYLQCDASDKAVAVAALQYVGNKLHPVRFLSRKLLPRECKYSIMERELLALTWGIKKLEHFLYSSKFIVWTDHLNLKYLKSATTNARIARWILYLMDFDFEIQHIKGTDNFWADPLSRLTV
ncbi:uncharacterized protein LOC129923423 [Biomphalaria glabrata]|uniref:Uncharacterized protein LOC129923423 n=1 Tax=Biomphalaria glabrata TaxID=6526 RepID=A0A9W2Z5T7_BIOGL|nr:uncharacterized protein LOC129923423 [Biomphalaria glabrata]